MFFNNKAVFLKVSISNGSNSKSGIYLTKSFGSTMDPPPSPICGTHHPKLQLDVTPYLLSGFPKPTFQHLELTPVGSELPLIEE